MTDMNNKEIIQFTELPVEVINLILLHCDVPDICQISKTCQRLYVLAKSEYVWYFKWLELCRKSGLTFPEISDSVCHAIDHRFKDVCKEPASVITSYYSRCRRMWCMLYRNSDKPSLPVCQNCEKKTCEPRCFVPSERKIALDIGSKITWALTTTFSLKRHPTVLLSSVPDRNSDSAESSEGFTERLFCPLCKDRPKMFGQCARVPKDPCRTLTFPLIPADEFLEEPEDKTSRDSQLSDEGAAGASAMANAPNEEVMVEFPLASSSPLWTELKFLLQNPENMYRIVSPLDCFATGRDFEVINAFIKHILTSCYMVKEVKKPNVSLVICEPYNSSSEARKAIATFLFNEMLVARLCFLNKAYSVATLLGFSTCVVIDSGAHNTVVTLIINGEVQVAQTRRRPVGGVTISEYLATAIKCNGIMENVNVTSLDSRAVKSSCYLSYNIAVEERRKVPIKHFIHVQSPSRDDDSVQDEILKCELGAELYLAPELMYAAMELPVIIKEIVDSLDPVTAKETLMHILLTGSNTELNGFVTRLIQDLQRCLPEYKHVVNVHTYVGSRSWDAGMGATRVVSPDTNVPSLLQPEGYIPGSIMWITREDYVLFGTNYL